MQRSSGTLGDWGGPASLPAPPRGFPLLAASALSLYENEVPGAFKPLRTSEATRSPRPHGPWRRARILGDYPLVLTLRLSDSFLS